VPNVSVKVTSFGGVPLHIRHERNRLARLKYLPISPSSPHPDHGALLEHEGEPLSSNSWVGISEAKIFSMRVLQPARSVRKLTSSSYKTLKGYVSNIPVHSYVPAANLAQLVVLHNASVTLGSRELQSQHNPNEYYVSESWTFNQPYVNHSRSQPILQHVALPQAPQSVGKATNRYVPPSYTVANSRPHPNYAAYGTFTSRAQTSSPPARSQFRRRVSRQDKKLICWMAVVLLGICAILLLAVAYGV